MLHDLNARSRGRRSKIVGVGHAVPSKVLTNHDLERLVDTSDEWIVERTGIRERRVLPAELSTSDLAAEAAACALTRAGVQARELDAIIVATVTPDTPMPATAVHVQQKIGANSCAAFDISAACAGFLYGLAIADGFVASGRFQRVLVIGVEVLSRITDWSDRNTCVLFGDGAGAAIVAPASDEASGIFEIVLASDGSHAGHLEIPAGGTREPLSSDVLASKRHLVQMNGRQVFTQAVRNMSAASLAVLDRVGLRAEDVDRVFAHQANLRILEGTSQRTGIPLTKFFNNIDRYGNTSSASVPIAMSEALSQGCLKPGDVILLMALGAGLAWGSAIMRW